MRDALCYGNTSVLNTVKFRAAILLIPLVLLVSEWELVKSFKFVESGADSTSHSGVLNDAQ